MRQAPPMMWFVAVVAGLVLFGFLMRDRRDVSRPEAFALNPNEYVYVEDDGSTRELDDEERDYLATPFHPNDGARPYVKRRYKALTPDGRIGGFLPRGEVPLTAKVRPSPHRS